MIGRVAIKLAGAALLVSCGADAGADAERVAVGPADGATGAATRQNNLAARRTVASAEDDERAEAAMAKLPQQDELFTYEASWADPQGYS